MANLFTVMTLLAGSGVVVSLLSKMSPATSIWLGVAVTLVQSLELVIQISSKARLHSSLAAEFLALDRALTRVSTPEPSPEALREFRAEVLLIETREPPIKRYLDLICHNQVAVMIGSRDVVKLKPWQQRLAHFLSGSTALQ